MNIVAKSMVRAVNPRNVFYYSKKPQNSGGIFTMIKDAFKQTFPSPQDEIRQKYKKVKEQKKYSKEELEKIQSQIPEYQRTALVKSQHQSTRKSYIPENLRERLQKTEAYKSLANAKDQLKNFVDESDSFAASVSRKASIKMAKQSSNTKAFKTMKQYMGEFSILELEKESTVIFLDAYNLYLEKDYASLSKICGEQALSFFKAHNQIIQTKKLTRKYPQILHHGEGKFMRIVMDEKDIVPTFVFEIKIMEVECLVDKDDKIVEGDEGNVVSCAYYFSLNYSGQHVDELGYPWQMVEVKKVSELNLLV